MISLNLVHNLGISSFKFLVSWSLESSREIRIKLTRNENDNKFQVQFICTYHHFGDDYHYNSRIEESRSSLPHFLWPTLSRMRFTILRLSARDTLRININYVLPRSRCSRKRRQMNRELLQTCTRCYFDRSFFALLFISLRALTPRRAARRDVAFVESRATDWTRKIVLTAKNHQPYFYGLTKRSRDTANFTRWLIPFFSRIRRQIRNAFRSKTDTIFRVVFHSRNLES